MREQKGKKVMRCKKAVLVINPRTGQNVAKLPAVLAVLSAAGWKTSIALKEYGGHTMALANESTRGGSGLVIAYGGDGTINQVVNGVMKSRKQQSVVGVIPGGTANLWAGDIGVPSDPVEAALALVNSEERKVDIGHVDVQELVFPHAFSDEQRASGERKKQKRKGSRATRHHFFLMAGLGFDAQIMRKVSKPLKYHIGPAAVGIAVAQALPESRPFPVTIRAAGNGKEGDILWQGEALQVVVGNTRRYAMIMEMTPNAYIDDGILDVCIIVAGDPLTTIEQVASLLLHRKPDKTVIEAFRGAYFSIQVPASVPLELDGSAVKLKDYLSKPDYSALQQTPDAEQVTVTYRFDALPHALEMAIPCTYNEELFEHPQHHFSRANGAHQRSAGEVHSRDHYEIPQTPSQELTAQEESQPEHEPQPESRHADEVRKEFPALIDALLERGRKVTVIGKAPNPDKKNVYVIAGTVQKQFTGEARPVAVVVNGQTTVFNREGRYVPADAVRELHQGEVIVVEGRQSKRGVIRADRVVVQH
jgi:YegS/Rv2252/BmrU family lipid kinase